MKKRLLTLLITAMILGSASLYAREPEVSVVSQGADKVAMKLFTYEASATIRIVDENGFLLFTEKTGKNPQYAKVFDMATLPAGSYHFEVEGQNTYQVIEFQVVDKKIAVIGKPETFYKPVMLQKGKIADLQLMNTAEQAVQVTFTNAAGQILLVDKPDTSIRIEKRFNLAELERGIYTMSVKVGDKFYYKKLIVE